MTVPSKNDAINERVKTLRSKLAEYKKTDEVRLAQVIDIGREFCELKSAGNFKGGEFDAFVQKQFHIKHAWRCLMMKLHIDRAMIPTVREWAEKSGLPNATASDVYKLFHEWELRDKTTGAPRPQLVKTVSKLSDAEKERIASLHATWADHGTPLEVAEKAELDLYRIAESQNPLLVKLLKKLKLELPVPRPDVTEYAEVPAALSGGPETTGTSSQNEQASQSDAFVPPSIAPSVADLDTSAEPTRTPAPSVEPKLPENGTEPDSDHAVFSPSVAPSFADLDRSKPERQPIPWKDKVTGEGISEERERDALAMVLKAREQTLQEHAISRKLAQLGIAMGPAKVRAHFMCSKKN